MIQKAQIPIALFLPGNIEYLLMKANSCGNMAWYGIYIRVYYTRNLVYLSMPVLYISYNYNYMYYGLIFFFFSLLMFRSACYNSFKYIY